MVKNFSRKLQIWMLGQFFGPNFGIRALTRNLKIAITPKLFGRQPSNFTTILPLSSSNKRVVEKVCRKWIVTKILIKIKVFVRKWSPSWFFLSCPIEKTKISNFFCRKSIFDIFGTNSRCDRYSPRRHPCACTSYIYIFA